MFSIKTKSELEKCSVLSTFRADVEQILICYAIELLERKKKFTAKP